ncbi:3809_t:CDS:2, partial [Acaulospora colombiana]
EEESEAVRSISSRRVALAYSLYKGPSKKATTGDAFEDVLYGSESEVEDSDTEEVASKKTAQKGAPKKGGKEDWNGATRLRVDDDEPMDLLEGTAGKLITANRGKQKRPGQEASKFKTEEETGKIIIDEETDSDVPEKAKRATKQNPEDLLAGAAYKENLVSVDGFTRNPNGTIKFHKDTKKRRREEMEMADGDIEMEDASAAAGVNGQLDKAKNRFDDFTVLGCHKWIHRCDYIYLDLFGQVVCVGRGLGGKERWSWRRLTAEKDEEESEA